MQRLRQPITIVLPPRSKRLAVAPVPAEPTTDDYLTPDEACELLRVSRDTLTRWERDGKLIPSRPAERVVLYSRRAIAAFVARHTEAA